MIRLNPKTTKGSATYNNLSCNWELQHESGLISFSDVNRQVENEALPGYKASFVPFSFQVFGGKISSKVCIGNLNLIETNTENTEGMLVEIAEFILKVSFD